MKAVLKIEKTQLSPKIILDKKNNTFIISGKSGIEDAHEFYQAVFDWFAEYFKNPLEKTEINLYLEYLNSASSLQIGSLIDVFTENRDKTDLVINWLFDEGDDLMEEVGKEFQYTYEMKFHFKELSNVSEDEFQFNIL
jgi:hypothetical protein